MSSLSCQICLKTKQIERWLSTSPQNIHVFCPRAFACYFFFQKNEEKNPSDDIDKREARSYHLKALCCWAVLLTTSAMILHSFSRLPHFRKQRERGGRRNERKLVRKITFLKQRFEELKSVNELVNSFFPWPKKGDVKRH